MKVDVKQKVMVKAQRRMAALPGAEEVLRGLACFEPSRRWTVGRAMRSACFESHRVDVADAAAAKAPEGTSLEYMHYLHDDA